MMICEIVKSLRLRENCVDGLIQEILARGKVRFGKSSHDGFASGSVQRVLNQHTRQPI
jgi:hypothetical protein